MKKYSHLVLNNQTELFLELSKLYEYIERNVLNIYNYDVRKFILCVLQEEAMSLIINYPSMNVIEMNKIVTELANRLTPQFMLQIFNIPTPNIIPLHLPETKTTFYIGGINYYLENIYNETLDQREIRIRNFIEKAEQEILPKLLLTPTNEFISVITKMIEDITDNHYFITNEELSIITMRIIEACNNKESCFDTHNKKCELIIRLFNKYDVKVKNFTTYVNQ